MGRTTKIVGFSVPSAVAEEVEQIAKEERRTKSELFQEMLRVYQRFREYRDREEERWVMDLIREAQAEQARHPLTMQEMLQEDEELAHYGATRAKQQGISARDIPCIIAASRKRYRSKGRP